MWGRKPTSNKGLRCGVGFSNNTCCRPAKRYLMCKVGLTLNRDICRGHLQMYICEGWTCTLIDRRKVKA